jgi:hypothetical protein
MKVHHHLEGRIFLSCWGFYLSFHVAREKNVLIFLFTFFFLENRVSRTQETWAQILNTHISGKLEHELLETLTIHQLIVARVANFY